MKIYVATYTKANGGGTKSFAALTRRDALKLCADDIRSRFYRRDDGATISENDEKMIALTRHAGWIIDDSIMEIDLHMPTIVVDASEGLFHGVYVDADEPVPDLTILMFDRSTETGAEEHIVETSSGLADDDTAYVVVMKPTSYTNLQADELLEAAKAKVTEESDKDDAGVV